MKLAFVTIFDASDVRNWSGTYLHMWQALEKQGFEIQLIDNLRHGRSWRRKLRKLRSVYLERRSFLHFWDVDTARDYAADVADRLQGTGADVVLSPTPVPLAFLDCPQPKFLWTDAIYSALSTAYPEFDPSLVGSPAVAGARAIDRAALDNCELLIFASEWGAEWALKERNAVPDKVHVVPFGANVGVIHTREMVRDLAARDGRTIRLLFVGVDWERKGGAKALEVVRNLHARGIDAELTIVGCSPPLGTEVPAFVRLLGFISKATDEGRRRLAELYAQNHFLIVPTMAEAYGLVFAEASAFGVPSLSHRVGGVTTIVRDEVNGRLFEIDQPASDWADWIVRVVRQPGRLHELAVSAFDEYEHRLNWNVAGRRVAEMIRERVAQRQLLATGA